MKFLLRLPDDLHSFLVKQALKDKRSINFTVVELIEKKKKEVENGK